MKIDEVVEQGRKSLLEILEEIPAIKIKDRSPTSSAYTGADFAITIEVKPTRIIRHLIGEVKINGQPAIARDAVRQLEVQIGKNSSNTYGIFIAPYLSIDAQNICKAAGIGFMDLAGNCYLSFDSVYVSRNSFPNLYPDRRSLNSLFSPKAERIFRVLVEAGPRRWKTQELSDEAQVSIGQTAKVKSRLQEREWIRSGKIGFELTQPKTLLDDWARSYRIGRNKVYRYYTLLTPQESEKELSDKAGPLDTGFAFTSFSAASKYAPMVRYQRLDAYLSSENKITEIANLLGWKEVATGANVFLYVPYDRGVLYATRSESSRSVVSATQTFLDVSQSKARGEEAAQALLNGVILERWK
ncbi:MAG: hypothetical protein EPO32_01490 [Anaerolineae bacterium]|nr:MAG: hypothetical protein EPO32_01490 [Anaerolineae bacterium]